MIEPVLSGEALLDEIRSTEPASSEVAIWWLGQSGFLIKSQKALILIDPYLSEWLTRKYQKTDKPHTRMTRCPVDPNRLTGLDFVICSHKHSDHMDPETLPALAQASPGCRFLIPASLIDYAVSLGLPGDRLIGLDDGDTFVEPKSELSVRAVKAAHEAFETDEAGRHFYLSFVVCLSSTMLFHSGDTMPWPGQAEAIGPGVDIAFLPINGRDPARRVAGNMNSEQAINLAMALKISHVIPHHYDMFTFNTVDVSVFDSAASRLPETVRPVILRCGERFLTTAKTGT
jgi:L-ascorbate 6-phosphate lactonase